MAIGFLQTVGQNKKDSKKKSAPKGLNAKRRKYLKLRLEGKNKTVAGRLAGFTESMARAAVAKIETPEFRAIFAAKAAQIIPEEKLILRLAEGLDAVQTKFATMDGEITDFVDCIDFEQRRKYLELAGEWTGRVAGKSNQTNVQVNVPVKVVIEHIGSKVQAAT